MELWHRCRRPKVPEGNDADHSAHMTVIADRTDRLMWPTCSGTAASLPAVLSVGRFRCSPFLSCRCAERAHLFISKLNLHMTKAVTTISLVGLFALTTKSRFYHIRANI